MFCLIRQGSKMSSFRHSIILEKEGLEGKRVRAAENGGRWNY